MNDLTLRQLSVITNLPLEDLLLTIQAAGKEIPDVDSPMTEEIRDLLSGSQRKKSEPRLGTKPLSLSKAKPTPPASEPRSEAPAPSTLGKEKKEGPVSVAQTTDKPKTQHAKAVTVKAVEAPKPSHRKATVEEDVPSAHKKILKNKTGWQPSPLQLSTVLAGDELASDIEEADRKMRRPKAPHARSQRPKTPHIRPREISLVDSLTVSELARKLALALPALQKHMRALGLSPNPGEVLDLDTAVLIAAECGVQAHIDRSSAEDLLSVSGSYPTATRPPVVTIMGHVDHGKTSLLDAIRHSAVTDKEAGGITQHIGAYQVTTPRGIITFIDTPGHEAFTAIRSRGTQCTDIVILVVACDDGIMAQTREALQHAQAAGVKIIVAITKIDRPNQKIDEIKNQLAQCDVTPDEWGGNTQYIGVSSKTKEGIPELLEAILLEAEMMELSARTEGPASGIVLEARLDKSLGAVATVLVQEGQLALGDFIVAGTSLGKVRRMNRDNGTQTQTATPAMPVEVIGLNEVPTPGDKLHVTKNEKIARTVVSERVTLQQKQLREHAKPLSLDEMFSQIKQQAQHQLNILLKADVHGSMTAIADALSKLSNDDITLKVISSGVGAITKTDAELAYASKAIILGFNVRPDAQAKSLLQERGIEVYYFSIIYELIQRVKDAIKGIVGPKWEQEIIGTASVREVFRSSKFGAVSGSMVQEGVIKRHAKVRVVRDHIVIFDGVISSLRRFSQDVEEVRKNTECGIGIKDYTDVAVGDILEAYMLVEKDRDAS